ncbi:hypothetical protein HI914_05334 [Erysiphe necator]|nr:hypothetical protein HI914_05334 [Erysiphe necator]
MRFFNRAIECYNEGLEKYQDSYDLAYNKSRVQFELTQHPKLLRLLPKTPLEHLEIALQSSKLALALSPDNPDILFNTAQILTSISEELGGLSHPSFPNPLQVLEEALGLFQSCIQMQELAVLSFREQTAAMASLPDSMDLDSDNQDISNASIKHDSCVNESEYSVVQDDRWATIIEPVTDETILDTTLASLECLTTYIQLVSSDYPHEIKKAEEYMQSFIQKLNIDLIENDRKTEACIIKAGLICAYATAQFFSSRIDFETYLQTINDAYTEIDLSSNPRGLCDFAESLIAYNKALHLHVPETTYQILVTRWKALTKAQEYLTSSSKISSYENLEKIHLTRGDVELLRFQLGQEEISLDIARENSLILLKNAEKYYRGSSKIAKNIGADTIILEANIKEGLAIALTGDLLKIKELNLDLNHNLTKSIFQDVVEDGIVTIDQLKKLGYEKIS